MLLLIRRRCLTYTYDTTQCNGWEKRENGAKRKMKARKMNKARNERLHIECIDRMHNIKSYTVAGG